MADSVSRTITASSLDWRLRERSNFMSSLDVADIVVRSAPRQSITAVQRSLQRFFSAGSVP
jgi:hypothetical protein